MTQLNRSLDQELLALLRGASLECLVCGEFVMRLRGEAIFCPECRSGLEPAAVQSGAEATSQVPGPRPG